MLKLVVSLYLLSGGVREGGGCFRSGRGPAWQPPLRAADPKPASITFLSYVEFLTELETSEHVHDFLINLESSDLSWNKHTLFEKHKTFHITNPET